MEIFETLRSGQGPLAWVAAAAIAATAAALAGAVYVSLRRFAAVRRSRPAVTAPPAAGPRRMASAAVGAAVRAYAGAVSSPERGVVKAAPLADALALGELLARLRRVAATLERLQGVTPAEPEPPASVEYLHRAV